MNKIQIKKPPVKSVVMLFVSIMVGAAGVYLTKDFIEKKIKFYRSQMEVQEELVQVVVPKNNMLRGEVVTSEKLALREFPRKYMDSNVVTDANFQISLGQRVNFDVDGGKPLLWAHLDGGLAPTFSGKIENGLRALTLRVDEINSISGFLQPKDHVDLMLTYTEGKKGKVTLPFMQSLYVLATGVKTVTDKTGRASTKRYNTITVQVSPENAKRLILAQDIGKITATLRHPDDGGAMDKEAMTVAKLLNKKKVKRKASKKRKAVARKKGIEFIIGGV